MDNALRGFLERQYTEAMALAEASDLLDLIPVEGRPPDRYIVHFSCKGLVRTGSEIKEADDFLVGIWMPEDYLSSVDPFRIVSWLDPDNVFHPNIGRGPLRSSGPLSICLGRIKPCMALVDLIYQCWEIITYSKATMREDDALNWDACRWARRNTHRFPIDTRPLKRRSIDIEVKQIDG